MKSMIKICDIDFGVHGKNLYGFIKFETRLGHLND